MIIPVLIKHYNDIIMGAIASQITSLTIVYSIVCSDSDQRVHQSSASLAFVRGILHTNGQLGEKCFHLMMSSWRVSTRNMRTTKTQQTIHILIFLCFEHFSINSHNRHSASHEICIFHGRHYACCVNWWKNAQNKEKSKYHVPDPFECEWWDHTTQYNNPCRVINTLRLGQNGWHFADNISNAFSFKKMFEFR